VWRVAVTESNWAHWLERLYDLRRNKVHTHESPHKPVLLLAILDLLDRGVLEDNHVPFNAELDSTFRRFFAVVQTQDDQPTLELPFYFLSGDGFWQVFVAGQSEPLYRKGFAGGAPSAAQLRRQSATGRFDAGLWALMSEPMARHQLREALIARYFPEHHDRLAALSAEAGSPGVPEAQPPALPPGRDTAFRRTVLELYDYRCAACGVRVLLKPQMSLVEAAHLIPFSISRNDRPTNGVALCPNHHWAMDRHLIAPCPDPRNRAGLWRINTRRLDDRIEGQRDLMSLAGKPVIPPRETMYLPAPESLRWREEQLAIAD
jgi:putative restriction endonuclease